ncbi:MAG: hypothetical protein HY653_04460 [Acidobacteria bacterium]|nr:hypothetical protein [Acidobacteriota bacterium]
MVEKWPTILVVGPGTSLRWTVEQLQRAYGYRVYYATDPYEASARLENTSVDALVCQAAPAYTADCKLIREICLRSLHLPIILFVEPDSEEYLLDELGYGTFHIVRPPTTLEQFHRILLQAIGKRHRVRAA